MSRIGILSAVTGIVLASSLNAEAGTHGGGIKGGLLISDPWGKDRDTYHVESIYTASFGAFYRYTFLGFLSAQADVLYAHKGAKGTFFSNEARVNIWYLDFVPTLQCRVLREGTLFGSLYAGPEVSVRLDASLETGSGSLRQSSEISDSVRRSDYGYAIGGKLGLSTGSKEFAIDAKYSSEFIAPDDTFRDIDLKNRTITIMLEMYFGKK